MATLPNPNDHPELIKAVVNFRSAQQAMTSVNYDDPSNFLDEQHKAEMPGRLHQGLIEATREVEKWCQHYGIRYNDALSVRLS